MNSEDAVNAVFEPLGWHQKDIRLATLLPADSEYDLIICILQCTNLDDAPKYEALSWAWGDASQTETILLHGEIWHAPQNLVAALRALRYTDKPRTLWIDALCINQSHAKSALHERGHQVSLMKGVYQSAERVIVWLGESKEWTAEFFANLHKLASPHLTTDEACQLISSHGRETRSRDWIFVKWLWEFITRAWWRRLWVLQEFALAREALVACDAHLIAFNQVLRAFKIIRQASKRLNNSRADSQRFISWGGYTSMIENLRRYGLCTFSYQEGPLDLAGQNPQLLEEQAFVRFAKLLAGCRFQLSTDPRDMVYGILGLSEDIVNNQITARYDLSTREVYMQTTLKLIHKTKSLFMLGQAQIAMWKPANSGLKTAQLASWIPSWVPDWSLKRREFGYSSETRCRSRVERERLFKASGGSRTKFHLINESILRLRGVKVDTVATLHKVWKSAGSEYIPNLDFLNKWASGTGDDNYHSLTNKSSSYRTSLNGAYIGGGDRVTAFWKSWVHDVHPVDEVEKVRRCDATFVPTCEQWRKTIAGSAHSTFPFKELVSFTTFINIRLVLTLDGFIGLGNAMIEPGDEIYILAGGTHPFVLRRSENKLDHYRIVGEVYVHGLMDGEVLTEEYGSAKRRSPGLLGKTAGRNREVDNLHGVWEDVFLE
jgi:Heterokaryon incompatibility protein (HET)